MTGITSRRLLALVTLVASALPVAAGTVTVAGPAAASVTASPGIGDQPDSSDWE